jgi:hypothetical protein
MTTAEATNQNNQVTNKGKAKKALLFSLGTLALGTLAFFGIKHFKKQKTENNDNNNQTPSDLDSKIPVQINSNNKPRTSIRVAATGASFPFTVRAKGNKVLELQQSLMRTYGAGIFPKHGADGEFGSELASFLRSKGYGVPLSEADFKKITQAQTQAATPLVAFDPAAIAKGVYNAIMGKDYSSAITLLKAISNPTNYSLVSEKFKLYRLNGGVRQTLVTAMLNSFSEKSQKENTKLVFKKMGLQYNTATNKWSLA